MKFLVVQTGARRGYAVPAILERAGMLERFYTDVCADVGLGRWLRAGRNFPFVGERLTRLNNRRLPAEIRAKTRTFFSLPSFHWPARRGGDPAREFRRNLRRHRRWTDAMVRAGFGKATHLFSMLSEAGSLFEQAKDRGLKIVSEVYILLGTVRLLKEERSAFPGWEPPAPDYDRIQLEESGQGGDFGMLGLSDLFICPSVAVRDDLVGHCGVPSAHTALVPYGVDPRWLDLAPVPKRGRVLFAGTADLRKGIHYFARAAERLAAHGLHYEFRVAGHVTRLVTAQSACRHLTFLGRLSRDVMKEEFRTADVFVLPSLAEGSAEVTYEALGSRLPLITTAESGSVARDGIEGRIVPARDHLALADAIEEIVEDRVKRERMAAAARDRARDFTWDIYGSRLLEALEAVRN